MAVAEPRGAVDGLEFDECQKGCDAGGWVVEQMVDDDEMEAVVHWWLRGLSPDESC